ncbi:hypothetical protein [Flavobacterium cellulosilyticum]|uniref:Uncharacterized protein n=1 Tax=Flavobacterium cellulosilyticum TaxID=2541731 RepID=A0A4R5CC62_9FLAO|nr:hypothetical protein [Flavobacterium cellulosilyticum]TDD94734.1 hypothetical protein E0F76_16010 [Flavobacterium cellulosilyticum]
MATKIYSGKHSNYSDQIFLVDKGKIYRGKYSIASDELISIQPEGILIVKNTKIFKGNHATSSNQIITVSNKNIYKGRHVIASNQIGVIEGDRLNNDEFAKIIYLLAKKNNLL